MITGIPHKSAGINCADVKVHPLSKDYFWPVVKGLAPKVWEIKVLGVKRVPAIIPMIRGISIGLAFMSKVFIKFYNQDKMFTLAGLSSELDCAQ